MKETNPDKPEQHQLAGNIVAVAGTQDPTAINDYLVSVLREPNNPNLPPAERVAAFHFLATEQRDALRTRTTEAGHTMVHDMGEQNQRAQATLGKQTISVSRRKLQQLNELHEGEVGRLVRSAPDARQLVRAHDTVADKVNGSRRAVTTHHDTFKHWSGQQEQTMLKFSGVYQSGVAHERALDAAAKTLEPGGEPRDLSEVIDEAVAASAAEKLAYAIAEAQEAGTPPEDAVTELLARETEVDMKTVTRLAKFAHAHAETLATNRSRVRRLSEDAGQSLQRFIRRGQDEYPHIRNADAAQETFRRQRIILNTGIEPADHALAYSGRTFEDSERALESLGSPQIHASNNAQG